MKRTRNTVVLSLVVLLTGLLVLAGPASAGLLARPLAQSGAPQVVSYQGQVTVAGIAYTGTGYFKFAVVDAAGTTTAWSNDATSTAGNEPTAAVTLNVTNGLFNVLLGDTALTNMTALPASAFNGTDRVLRVWFSSNGTIFTQLSPDRRIAAVPYALQASEALTVPDGSITQAKLAANSVTSAAVTDGGIKSRDVQLSVGNRTANIAPNIILDATYQSIPGTSVVVTPDTAQTYLVYVTADLHVSGASAGATLFVDGVPENGQAAIYTSYDVRATVSQIFLVNLSAGSHNLGIRAVKNYGTWASIWTDNTRLVYFAVSQ